MSLIIFVLVRGILRERDCETVYTFYEPSLAIAARIGEKLEISNMSRHVHCGYLYRLNISLYLRMCITCNACNRDG